MYQKLCTESLGTCIKTCTSYKKKKSTQINLALKTATRKDTNLSHIHRASGWSFLYIYVGSKLGTNV